MLLAAVVVTGLGGVWLGGVAWAVFLLTYVALVGYLVLLVQLRARREEAQRKVHVFPDAGVVTSAPPRAVRVRRGA